MPFWKKSEDPWDIKPKKQAEVSPAEPSAPEEEPGAAERFFDALDARLDARAEARREKDAPSVPMACPWCGRDMEQGYLFGGRGGVLWSREKPGMFSMLGDCVPVDTDGDFWSSYKLSWHCPACCRLVADFHPSGTADGEYSQFQEELQRYAKQAKETESSK